MKTLSIVYLLIFSCLLAVAEEQRPNVLLITADDMGWDSLGCTGNPIENITPHLDQLAAEGLLIEHGHITTPICGPSRESLYTGLYPQSSGYMGHGVQPPSWWLKTGGKKPKTSISTQLKDAGYITGLVGKHGSTACRFTEPAHGRNEHTGMGRNPQKYFDYVRRFLAKAKTTGKPFFLAANAHDPHRYWAQHPDETKGWIKNMMGDSPWKPLPNGKPYPDPLLQISPKDCPIPPSYPQDSRLRKPLSYYYGSVNRMDSVVGEVLRALEESSLRENTLVIFLSDHGLAWEMSKWSLYPAGTKTPVIIRWPKKIASGQVNGKSVVSTVDIAPTIADACRIEPATNIDGRSFYSLLTDNDKESWSRTEAFTCFNYMNNSPESSDAFSSDLYQDHEQYRPSRAMSSKKFTYIWNGWSDGKTVTPGTMGNEVAHILRQAASSPEDSHFPNYQDHADFIKRRTPEELYQTDTDPGCLKNLVDAPQFQDVLKRYRKKMEQVLSKTKDHELANYRNFLSQP